MFKTNNRFKKENFTRYPHKKNPVSQKVDMANIKNKKDF
jgi:hypothetical protein